MAKHFLRILDLDRGAAHSILERALEMKRADFRGDCFKGKNATLLFQKASTRTRVSFDVAIRHLGGDTIFMTPAESQLGRSEPLRDTARVLSRYTDCLVVRTFGQEILDELAEYATVPVINALSDLHHPCQVMSDMLTIYERTPELEKVRVAWIGDGNNMAHSWIEAAVHFPIELFMAFPPEYTPKTGILEHALQLGAKIFLTHDPELALDGAHYVNTDVWASMGQESQQGQRARAFQPYQVNAKLMELASPDAKFMHCLPAHRGEEVTDEIIESPASIVWDQAENRLHMQKALLEWIIDPTPYEPDLSYYASIVSRKKGVA